MKRRVNALASSTSKAAKRRSWRDDGKSEEESNRRGTSPDSDGDEDADETHIKRRDGGAQSANVASGSHALGARAAPLGPNPVVWLDLSIAGKLRGRVHIELFKDVAPKAAENFRRLCEGIPIAEDCKVISYRGSELDTLYPGRYAEGGDLNESADLPSTQEDSAGKLEHAKGGLLTAEEGVGSFGSSRFQLTFGAVPELDGRQVVFGQLIGCEKSAKRLHPLHWVEAYGTTSGTPREVVKIEDCGECGPMEAAELIGAQVMGAQMDGSQETQEARYGRAGLRYGKLEDAISEDTIAEVLDLTDDMLGNLEWDTKKARLSAEKLRKSEELEASLKALTAILDTAKHKAGEVKGFDGKLGRMVQSQVSRARDLEQSVTRWY